MRVPCATIQPPKVGTVFQNMFPKELHQKSILEKAASLQSMKNKDQIVAVLSKKGRVAQRITRLTTDQKIAGSNPAVLETLFYLLFLSFYVTSK